MTTPHTVVDKLWKQAHISLILAKAKFEKGDYIKAITYSQDLTNKLTKIKTLLRDES